MAVIALRMSRPGVLVVQAALVVLAAVAVAVVVDQVRPATTSSVVRVFDARPAGEQAVDDAQRRLAAAPQDPRAMTRLATAYMLRVRETGDPSYYPRAETLLA